MRFGPIAVLASAACAASGQADVPAPAPAVADVAPSIVAVFDLEDGSGSLSPNDAQQLADYLSARIASVPHTRVVPRDQVRGAIAQAKADSFRACFDQSCQIELGKALSAEKSVATKLLRVGSRCAVTIAWFDLKTETAEKAASTKTECGADALFAAIDDLVRQLGGAPAGAEPARLARISSDEGPPPAAQVEHAQGRALDLVLDESKATEVQPVIAAPSGTASESPPGLQLVSRGRERIVMLAGPVTFAPGRDDLGSDAKKVLGEAAAAIMRDARLKNQRLEVVGYADTSERGKAELSERRARNTRTYLISHGLTLAHLGVVASADADPNKAGVHHRRVELRLALDD